MKTTSILALALVGCQVSESAPPPPPLPVVVAVPPPIVSPAVVAATPPGITPVQMIEADVPATGDVAAPWTLTASDGSGLHLTRVDARAVVQGPLAFTELHLYFHNPEDRTREGTFAITLPSGAAVSRFAMESDGQWQEAEVVEKATARRAYDDFLHRRQDPALLEKAAGNQFTAKVFPIPAKADKHLVMSFSSELAGRAYTLPLRGLPTTERVDVQLRATKADGSPANPTLSERNWQPDRDFVATVPATAAAVTAGSLVVAAVSLAATGGPLAAQDAPHELTLLVDTSASRALGFATYVTSIHALVDALRTRYGDPLELSVVAFDQDNQPIFDGLAADYGDAQDRALLARGAAGASNLAQVIDTLRASGKPVHRRVATVTDGVVTAGPDTPALITAIQKLPIDRFDVVLAGGIRDEHLAAAIVRSGLPHAGDVYDLDRGILGVAVGLGEPVLTDLAIEVPGATWSYPKTVAAARPGRPVMVYARMARPSSSIEVVIGGSRRTLVPGAATPALIERAVAEAEIDELETKLAAAPAAGGARALRDDIAKRSVRARVISTQTSMLVLETDADYARYQIDRTALADILVVGPGGIEQTHRRTILAAKHAPARPQDDRLTPRREAIDQARTAGVLGSATAGASGFSSLSSGFDDRNVYGGLLGDEAGEAGGGFGFGRAGYGPGGGGAAAEGAVGTARYGAVGAGTGTRAAGYGVGGGRGGMRGRASAVPTVSIGQPMISGDLDRSVIRRYIKRHIQQITYCYEKELLSKWNLAGTVATQFFIASDGRVTAANATGVDPEVASCVAGVIKTIEFPTVPSGGSIQVNYPFMFRRSGADVPDASAPADTVESPAPPPAVLAVSPPVSTDDEDRGAAPLTGKLASVMRALRRGDVDHALAIARPWHEAAPGDVLALVALGESLEARKDFTTAARIYGSIIDLFSTRADLRRFAGERLERLGARSRKLVIDTYRKAVADRPDHVTGHRLLAYALLRDGDPAGAFAAILAGIDQKYPDGRFLGAERVLGEDAGMIAAVYLAHGGKREPIQQELTRRSLALAEHASTRFILYWETDANDVDFHIRDASGGHAWYQHKELASGGELYADVTTGYGPECFAIEGKPAAGPYHLSLNYYSQGPMGYGMGLVQIQRFDGKNVFFDDRPYVIMADHAFVDVGTYL